MVRSSTRNDNMHAPGTPLSAFSKMHIGRCIVIGYMVKPLMHAVCLIRDTLKCVQEVSLKFFAFSSSVVPYYFCIFYPVQAINEQNFTFI